jgi:hypothetical protein
MAALDCDALAKGAVVMGRRVVNDEPLSLAHGDGIGYPASVQNRTFHLHRDGSMGLLGPLNLGFGIEGVGAFFPNPNGQIIDPGNLMMLNPDGSVTLCPNATDVFGVSAKKCAIILNGEPFCWSGRYLKDEWGNVVMEDYHDSDDNSTQKRPMQNPAYDPKIVYSPRINRPQEWTLVVMSGMVLVRIDATVRVGDRIWSSTVPGVGKKTTNLAVLRCTAITKPFTAAVGYGIAMCTMGSSISAGAVAAEQS